MKREVASTTEDLTVYWFCPKDGSQLTEVALTDGAGGRFEVSLELLDVAIDNAEAVGKLDPEQVEEAKGLARKLLESEDRECITLISVECPQCHFKGVAPLMAVTSDKKTYEKQIKTVKKVMSEAQRTRRKTGTGDSTSYRWIWYLVLFGGSAITFLYYMFRAILGG